MPLAHGSLTLGNILEPHDSLVFFDPDNAVRIMIRDDSVTSIFLKDIIYLSKAQQVSRQFITNPVSLEGFSSAAIISLGDLTGPGHIGEPESSAISGASGSNSIFPNVPVQNAGVFPADNLPDIDYVHLTEGMVELMVTNGLPVGITLEILMKNEHDGSHIGVFSFNNLEPGQSLVSSGSLEGKVVRNHVSLEIICFTSPGSGDDPVFIDLNDAIDTDLGLVDTIAIDINPGDLDIIESLSLSLEVYNNFPLGAGIDEILYDSVAGTVLYTFENILLAGAASVDADGLASTSGGTVSQAQTEVSGDVSYSMMNNSYSNIGLGMALRGGGFQFYVVTDNVIPALMPHKTRNANIWLGLNLVLGHKSATVQPTD